LQVRLKKRYKTAGGILFAKPVAAEVLLVRVEVLARKGGRNAGYI